MSESAHSELLISEMHKVGVGLVNSIHMCGRLVVEPLFLCPLSRIVADQDHHLGLMMRVCS